MFQIPLQKKGSCVVSRNGRKADQKEDGSIIQSLSAHEKEHEI